MIFFFFKASLGTSVVVQWLRLYNPCVGSPGLIPGQGTRSHMLQPRVHMLQLKIPHTTTRTGGSQHRQTETQPPLQMCTTVSKKRRNPQISRGRWTLSPEGCISCKSVWFHDTGPETSGKHGDPGPSYPVCGPRPAALASHMSLLEMQGFRPRFPAPFPAIKSEPVFY